MQLKQFYNIATEAEKSATTFGDLPDCWDIVLNNNWSVSLT